MTLPIATVIRAAVRERRLLRFLDEGDFERLRDFFRLESVGEEVWLLLFFFFSLPSFGVTALSMIETTG